MFHYATKADLKNATGLDVPSLEQKTDLANLKSDEDKLDINKLKCTNCCKQFEKLSR